MKCNLSIIVFILLQFAFINNSFSQRRCQCASPLITSHPVSVNGVCVENGQAVFVVEAAGIGPLNYQWQQNMVNISDNSMFSGTKTSTLTVINPDFQQNGSSFRCLVTNCTGVAVASDNNCTLILDALPTDIDTDGVTDNSDFGLLLRVYNDSCTGCREDINQDGNINVIDFLRLVGRFNQSCF